MAEVKESVEFEVPNKEAIMEVNFHRMHNLLLIEVKKNLELKKELCEFFNLFINLINSLEGAKAIDGERLAVNAIEFSKAMNPIKEKTQEFLWKIGDKS